MTINFNDILQESLLSIQNASNGPYGFVGLPSGRMSEEEWENIIKVGKGMGKFPLYLTDKRDWKIENFCKKVREDVEETGAKIIFIDYLQLFSTRERLQNRYEEVALCTRELKLLARELNLPVIVASQLNRNVENRTTGIFREKKPQMFDLRDSGTICDDANVVMLLYRPEYYTRSSEDENGNDIRGLAEVIIAKNHMGREDTIRLKFSPETSKFEDWEPNEPEISFLNRPNYKDTLDNFNSLSSPF